MVSHLAYEKRERDHSKFDELVKSPLIVMPDPGSSPGQARIRHPEHIDFTGFRRSPE